MSVVQVLVFGSLFLIGLCAITHYTRKSPLPTVCWFVLAGIAYGILRNKIYPALPTLQPTPDIILYIMLPVLIFDASRKLDLRNSEQVATPAIVLASLGIIVSMFVMAVPIKLMSRLEWIDILFFTAIMSATDPVAVAAVFAQFKVPERLRMLIEGESLLNDGTTLILFTLMYDAVIHGETLIFHRGLFFFAVSTAGAVAMGSLAGAVCFLIYRQWHALKDSFVGPMFPLLVIYLLFCAAQAALDISGIIAVMAATLTMRILVQQVGLAENAPQARMAFYREFWNFLAELANAVLFFMLGVEIGEYSGGFAWKLMIACVVALLVARSVVVYGFGLLFRGIGHGFPLSWLHVLNLGGLKGALSIALVLMIPRTYPYRHLFMLAALFMSLFTLLANTIGMRMYLNRVDLGRE